MFYTLPNHIIKEIEEDQRFELYNLFRESQKEIPRWLLNQKPGFSWENDVLVVFWLKYPYSFFLHIEEAGWRTVLSNGSFEIGCSPFSLNPSFWDLQDLTTSEVESWFKPSVSFREKTYRKWRLFAYLNYQISKGEEKALLESAVFSSMALLGLENRHDLVVELDKLEEK